MKPSELRRHKDRGSYDINSIEGVFSSSFIAHVSYVDNGLPQCLPMIALFHSVGGDTAVYLHGHPSSRLMELVWRREKERAERAGAEEQNGNDDDDRIRVCITATKSISFHIFSPSRWGARDPPHIPTTAAKPNHLVDGLVLSSAPNGHTFNYRSAVIHGACFPVQDRTLKRDIMESVTNHIVPNRRGDLNPVASFQVSLVYVIRVEILSGSLKSRTGIPGIQPRDVERDGPSKEELVWTGVVPLYERLDVPVASGLTDGAVLPSHLIEFIKQRNEKEENYSKSVARW
jgi:uncharacterized protein